MIIKEKDEDKEKDEEKLNEDTEISVGDKKMKLGKQDAGVLNLLNRLTAVINVLNELELFGKNKEIRRRHHYLQK